MREDFGIGGDIPDVDSDLENEVRLLDGEIDERRDRIKLGIDHVVSEAPKQNQLFRLEIDYNAG
jgi:hypothetical protein